MASPTLPIDAADLADGVASLFDGIAGNSVHQLCVLVEAGAATTGETIVGDDNVRARPDGHIIVAGLDSRVPYTWRHTHNPGTRLEEIPALRASVGDITVAELVEQVVGRWVDLAERGDLDDELDDRVRDHPAVVPAIRAARAAGIDVGLSIDELGDLDIPAPVDSYNE